MKPKTKVKKTEIGLIPEGWEVKKIEDMVDILTGYPFKSKEYSDEGIRVLRGENVSLGFLRWDNDKRWNHSTDDFSKYFLDSYDVVIGMDGSRVGKNRAMIKDEDLPLLLAQRVARLRPLSGLNPHYLRYVILSNRFYKYVEAIKTGTSIPHISTKQIADYSFAVPPIDEQKAIGIMLSVLDDKIALNTQINQTLEAMAQAIFKSWFVDFEPVKAKIAAIEAGEDSESVNRAAMRAISGKSDDELDKMQAEQPDEYAQLEGTAELFPAAMWDSELGEVPEGWEVKPLDQIANYQNGLALQKFRPENENDYLPVLKIAQLKKGVADSGEKASPNIKPECIVDNGDVVFSWSGSLMVDLWCGGKVALNQHLFKVTSEKYPKWFYYYYTKHHLTEFQHIAAAKAVTMGHIKREHLRGALCVSPGAEFLKVITQNIDHLVKKIIVARLESFMLQEIRDTILPKLLSGELSIDAMVGRE